MLEQINKLMDRDFSKEQINENMENRISDYTPAMVTLSINGGRKNKISAGDILGALTSDDGIPGSDVGKIDRLDYLTFVAVKRDSVEKAINVLENKQVKGRRFKAMIND
jgi:ATP-independent RNA helicase DbpA